MLKTPAFILLSTSIAFAQNVRVPFNVETKNAYLTHFERANVEVLQNKKVLPILQFYKPGRPKHILVLAEFSGALPGQNRTFYQYESAYFQTLLEIAYTVYGLTKHLEFQDSIALATYDLIIRPVTVDEGGRWNFVRERGQVYRWLENFLSMGYRVDPPGRESAPYTALHEVLLGGRGGAFLGIEELLRVDRNLAVVLISGGASTFEKRNWDDVLRAARNVGVPIFMVQVGFQSYVNAEKYGIDTSQQFLGRHWLSQLAKASGGKFYETRDPKDGFSIAGDILTRLNTGYVVYVSAESPARKFERFQIRLKDSEGQEIKKFWNPIEEKFEKVKVTGRDGVEK